MDFMKVLESRYSVRKFDAKMVEDDKIRHILEAARLAPTAVNKQPERLLVLRTEDEMRKLAECTKYTFGAPAAIIVAVDEEKAWVRRFDGENSGLIDGSIAGTYIMLTICALGLGTCWVGHFDPDALRKNFDMSSGLRPVAIFPFGYPAVDSAPSAQHEKRLQLSELVSYGTFQGV